MPFSDEANRVPAPKRLAAGPFHMAQDQIQEGASLIFITYQQLIEPVTRRAGGLEQVLEDAVICVDEAHNLPQVARDAASCRGRVCYTLDTRRGALLPRRASRPREIFPT